VDKSPESPSDRALADARKLLLASRDGRVRPGRDYKVLADWNALAICGLVRASSVFHRTEWLDRAVEAYRAVRAVLQHPDGSGRIGHAWRLGRVTAAGLLDDQAGMGRAALCLYEATGVAVYLTDAIAYVEAALAHFADQDGSFFTTADDATDVPRLGGRPRTVEDNAFPVGNGVMAEVMARLYHLTGETRWADRTTALIGAFSGNLQGLSSSPTLLAAADFLERGATVVVSGSSDRPETAELVRAALSVSDPAVVVLRGADGLPESHPAYGKTREDHDNTSSRAFICRQKSCGLPVETPEAVLAALIGVMKSSSKKDGNSSEKGFAHGGVRISG